MAEVSSQMVPDIFNDLLSLDLKGGAEMTTFIQRKKLRWGILSGFISKGRPLCSCEELLFLLFSSQNKRMAPPSGCPQDPVCFCSSVNR